MCSFVRRRITIPQPSNQSTAAAAVVQVQAAPVTPLPVFKGLIPQVLQVPVPAPAIVAPVPSVRLSVPNFCNTQAAIASGPPAAEVAVRAAETHVAVVNSWEGWSTNPRAIQAWILGITEKTTLRLDRHGRTEDYEIRPRHGHLVVDYISRKTFNGRAVTKKIEIGSINICRMKFFYSINSRDLHQGFKSWLNATMLGMRQQNVTASCAESRAAAKKKATLERKLAEAKAALHSDLVTADCRIGGSAPTPAAVLAIHDCLRILRGLDPDRAALQNNVGFNSSDSRFGHSLADASTLPTQYARVGREMTWRYRRQLPPDLLLAAHDGRLPA